MKIIVWFLLTLQIALVGVCTYCILTTDSPASIAINTAAIAMSIAFGAINVHTLTR